MDGPTHEWPRVSVKSGSNSNSPPVWENLSVERYTTIIHESLEGGFWAEVPALPGCYSQGETLDELKENIREAIAGVLEVMKEQGTKPESNVQIMDIAV